jgi:hypothetical protein
MKGAEVDNAPSMRTSWRALCGGREPMSELTDRVRKMLAQAQVFARDTPFEAVARTRQVLHLIEESLSNDQVVERKVLEGQRALAAARLLKYDDILATWQENSRLRGERFVAQERYVLSHPLRDQTKV